MRRTVSAVGSRFPNEVSGTRSITLDLFLSSPYLRQTFTLFTTLLRARSGQLSFVEWSHLTMTPPFRQQMQCATLRAPASRSAGRTTGAGRCRRTRCRRSHTLDTHLRFNDYWYLFSLTVICVSVNL